jgi:hypothetical protein
MEFCTSTVNGRVPFHVEIEHTVSSKRIIDALFGTSHRDIEEVGQAMGVKIVNQWLRFDHIQHMALPLGQ